MKRKPIGTYDLGERAVAMAHSPACDNVATSTSGGAVHIWDSRTGDLVFYLEGRGKTGEKERGIVTAISYSRDWIACGTSKGDIEMYQPTTGKLVRSFVGLDHGHVMTIKISELEKFMVFGGGGMNATGFVKVWDLKNDRIVREIKAHGIVCNSVIVTNDDAGIISCGVGPDIKFWDMHTGQLQGSIKINIAGRKPEKPMFDRSSLEMMRKLLPEMMEAFEGSMGGVTSIRSLHPAYSHYVACLENDVAVILEMSSGTYKITPIKGNVATILWRWEDARAVTGTSKGDVIVWDLHTGKQVLAFQGHDKEICAITAPNPVNIITGDSNGVLRVWEVPLE